MTTMQPEALGPTTPAHAPVQVQPPAQRKLIWPSIAAVAAILGILIGIAIGRSSTRGEPRRVADVDPEQLAQLVVTSKPVDANVTVDGRFVGVAPVERIDLQPGRHSVVIDAFGYQPYAGTLEVDPKAKASLKVVLAPIGDAKEATRGDFAGLKTSSNKAVPPTALMSLTGTGAAKDAPGTKKPAGGGGGGASRPPPPPRRDCYGERDRCKSTCRDAETSCSMSCFGCGVCTSNFTPDQCKEKCDSCRSNCKSNVTFCESTCDGQYSSCQSSQ